MKLLRLLLCVAALVAGLAAAQAAPAAVPSIHDVYTAATTGHVAQARRDIDQVLAAYPDSAKAHYVSARVAALQGDWPRASRELAKAQSLDPGLGFERRDTLQAFTRQIAAHTAPGAAPARRGFPMGAVGIALVVLALIVLWGVYRASRRPPVQVMNPGWPGTPGAAGQAPYPPGYPPQPMGQAPYGAYPPAQQGSGILGAVGTGLAVGAGMAAGQMVVDKLFDRGGSVMPEAQAAPPMADAGAALPDDQDFGINDAGSWTDDSSGSWGDDSSGSDNWS